MPDPERGAVGGGGIDRPSADFGGIGKRGGGGNAASSASSGAGRGGAAGSSTRVGGLPDGGRIGRADSWPLEVTRRRGGGRSGGGAAVDGRSTGGRSTGGRSTGGRSTGGRSTGGEPGGGRSGGRGGAAGAAAAGRGACREGAASSGSDAGVGGADGADAGGADAGAADAGAWGAARAAALRRGGGDSAGAVPTGRVAGRVGPRPAGRAVGGACCSRMGRPGLPPRDATPAAGADCSRSLDSSGGGSSPISPSRFALRRTRSACASSMLDECVFTPMPNCSQRSSTALSDIRSSLASS